MTVLREPEESSANRPIPRCSLLEIFINITVCLRLAPDYLLNSEIGNIRLTRHSNYYPSFEVGLSILNRRLYARRYGERNAAPHMELQWTIMDRTIAIWYNFFTKKIKERTSSTILA